MRKLSLLSAMVLVLALVTGSVALAGEPPSNAGGPTCAGLDLGHGALGNHGDHIKDDYVNPGEPGGAEGGPAHFSFPAEVGPGASFCLEQAQAQSPSTPPGRS